MRGRIFGVKYVGVGCQRIWDRISKVCLDVYVRRINLILNTKNELNIFNNKF